MLSIVLIILLGYSFYVGYMRGFALQLVYSVGYTLSYLVASFVYKGIGKSLELWIPFPSATEETRMVFFDEQTALQIDKAFYAAVGFLIAYFVGYLIVRLIGLLAHRLNDVRLFGDANKILGGLAGAFAVYIGVFLILSLLSLVPINALQNFIGDDLLARAIIERTPIFSGDIHKLWITDILGSI